MTELKNNASRDIVSEMEKLTTGEEEEWEVKCGRCLPCGKVRAIPIEANIPLHEAEKDYSHLFPDNVAHFIALEKNKIR